MRISDWSSDVCSSDLQGDHGGRIYRPILLNYNRIFRCVACLGMELLQRVALWVGRSGTGCDDLGMMDLETVLIVCFAIAGLQALAWIRSEEHTSELQSLMRISYAVFCLKKTTIGY